ncbi:hypothetical protein PZH44_16025, partial [Alistipes putredinis]|nr:hypothetical protein [Alistipes putredinis]
VMLSIQEVRERMRDGRPYFLNEDANWNNESPQTQKHYLDTYQDVYRIGYLPEERGLYKKMKVAEQAVFFARLKGLSRHEAVVRLKKWFVKFGIESWWDR